MLAIAAFLFLRPAELLADALLALDSLADFFLNLVHPLFRSLLVRLPSLFPILLVLPHLFRNGLSGLAVLLVGGSLLRFERLQQRIVAGLRRLVDQLAFPFREPDEPALHVLRQLFIEPALLGELAHHLFRLLDLFANLFDVRVPQPKLKLFGGDGVFDRFVDRFRPGEVVAVVSVLLLQLLRDFVLLFQQFDLFLVRLPAAALCFHRRRLELADERRHHPDVLDEEPGSQRHLTVELFPLPFGEFDDGIDDAGFEVAAEIHKRSGGLFRQLADRFDLSIQVRLDADAEVFQRLPGIADMLLDADAQLPSFILHLAEGVGRRFGPGFDVDEDSSRRPHDAGQ